MSESPKQPKIIARGAFKATDKPMQYHFVLHQDNKSYQPRHSVPAGQVVTPTASQPTTSQTAQTTSSVSATNESTTEISWLGVAITLAIIAGLIYLAIKYWYWIVFILLIAGSLLFLLWIFSLGGSGGGSGSWEDGYYAGYDEYQLWHEHDHDNDDGFGDGDWY